MIDGLTDGSVVGSRKKRTRDIGGVRVERQKETCASKSKKQFEKQMENLKERKKKESKQTNISV